MTQVNVMTCRTPHVLLSVAPFPLHAHVWKAFDQPRALHVTSST